MTLCQRAQRALEAFFSEPPCNDIQVAHESGPLASENAMAQRREAAMSLMDDEVQGYLLVRITDPESETAGDVAMMCPKELWPLVLVGIDGLNEAIKAEEV